MNFSEDQLQQVEDYLAGKMATEKIEAFEISVKNNSELAEYVGISKSMAMQYSDQDWEFVKDFKTNKTVNNLELDFKADEVEVIQKTIEEVGVNYFKKEEKQFKKTNLYTLLAVAASVAVLLGLFLNTSEQTNIEIYADYSDWSELPSLTSRSTTEDRLLVEGEKAFLSKNFKQAIIHFEAATLKAKTPNVSALLYLGVSQLELDQHDAALISFQQIIKSNTLDQSKGYWYSALVYLKMDDEQNAVTQLRILANNHKNYNAVEAKKLLKALEN